MCCLASLKQANYVREQYADADVYVFYIDLRAMGRNEDFLARIQADEKVRLIKGKIAKVTEDPATKDVIVEAVDDCSGKHRSRAGRYGRARHRNGPFNCRLQDPIAAAEDTMRMGFSSMVLA